MKNTFFLLLSSLSLLGSPLINTTSFSNEIFIQNKEQREKYKIDGEGKAYYGVTQYTPNTESLVVELGPNSVFRYNEVLNLKDRDYSQNLFSFFPITTTPRLLDAYTMKVQFTDAYNPSKYLIVEYSASREGLSHGVVYIKAAGQNQTPTGFEEQLGKIHVGTIWGFGQNCNMYCCNKDSSLFTEEQYVSNSTSIYFDYETGEVNTNKNSYGFNHICNIKSSDYFDQLWDGMTTGECFVSIWFENYICPSASLCITNIDKKDLSNDEVIDQSEPLLVVDELFEELPTAIVGQKYSFYNFKAYDQYDGELEPKIKVYQNYYSQSRINVSASKDGFVPTKAGTYYIEYSATDYSSNTATKVYQVQCVKEAPVIGLSLMGEYKTSAYVGETIDIAKINIQDACGNPNITQTISLPNGGKMNVDQNFVPTEPGTYTVEYSVSDFVGTQANISYQISVTYSEFPIIEGDAKLLPYYIAGYEYQLPMLNSFDYKAGGTVKTSKIKLVDNGETNELTDGKVIFAQSANKARNATLIYEASNAKGSTSKEYQIKIFSASYDGFIHMENYFDLENSSIVAGTNCVTISSSNNGTATFINNLDASSFEIDFLFVQSKNNFEKFNIYLQDSENENEVLKFSYLYSNDYSHIIINDKASVVKEGAGLFNGGEQFIKLDSLNKKVRFKSNEAVSLTNFLNGEEFNGFTSKSVYLTIEFVNPQNNSCAVDISYLNSQKLSNLKYDYIEPKIVLNGDFGGAGSLNNKVSICSARAFDVLDPTPRISLSVFDGSRKPVKDVNGNLISEISCEKGVEFITDKYGSYSVTYTAYDYDGNEANYYYIIGVYDRILPTITLNGTNKTSAKLNETIKIATASASDNVSPAEKIKLSTYIILPTGNLVLLTSNSYTFTELGKHIIRYVAIDEENNISIVDNPIIVTEA